MSKLKVFLSDSLNPHLNLATEEWIFHNLDPSTQILFLWRNEHTVVIGRNQNPWTECNLPKMKQDGVHLARRTTGGGAVFHDLGNTNFTFLSPKDQYLRENNIQIILNALKAFGIQAEASGRNDLLVPFIDGPRKFSGSAYREKKDRAFHHGTLLLHADLTQLGHYLTPHPKKLQAKGKESVRSRVANLSEVMTDGVALRHDPVVEVMIDSFENFYHGKAEIESLTMESLQRIPELAKQYELLSSWEWLYGNTLEFNHKMDDYLTLGFFEFHFKVEDGRVQDLQIFTDALYPELIDELRTALRGQNYSSANFTVAMQPLMARFPDLQSQIGELRQWLCQNIEV
jgi:lipoate-protein ligase A